MVRIGAFARASSTPAPTPAHSHRAVRLVSRALQVAPHDLLAPSSVTAHEAEQDSPSASEDEDMVAREANGASLPDELLDLMTGTCTDGAPPISPQARMQGISKCSRALNNKFQFAQMR